MIDRQTIQRLALATVGVVALATVASGWRVVSLRRAAADLKLRSTARGERLAEDRRTATKVPDSPQPAALDRSRAVSRLRETLGSLAAKDGCGVDEFQATTEETPYVTTYAPDTKAAGWMQVPVRVQLHGASKAVVAVLDGLRTLDVPIEIDSLEMTRKSTDKNGMATVGAAIGVRGLVYRGEA